MTQEDKELLLKDLCARLPYEVKGRVYAETTKGEYDIDGDMVFYDSPFDVTLDSINTSTEEIHVIAIGNEDTVDFIEDQQIYGKPYTIDEFKPYLRPMACMTEEEKEFVQSSIEIVSCENYFDWYSPSAWDAMNDFVNYCDSHYLDHRGLIWRELAIEAPEGMYKFDYV